MKLTAKDLLDLGVIDEVLKEPNGNAKTDVEKMSETIKKKIVRISKELQQMDKAELLPLSQNWEKGTHGQKN